MPISTISCGPIMRLKETGRFLRKVSIAPSRPKIAPLAPAEKALEKQ